MKGEAMLLDVLIGVLVVGAAAAIGFASLDPSPISRTFAARENVALRE